MEKIIKKDGFVYLVEGDRGFETIRNMGKDIDDPRWKEEVEKMVHNKPKKVDKKKKSEE